MQTFDRYPSRRAFLLASTAGIAVLTFGRQGAFAQPAHVFLDSYRPRFFAASEWAFIKAATARLIPEDGDGPGALSTHVPIFIDRQLAGAFGAASDWYMDGPHDLSADPLLGFQSPLTPAEIYRTGIVAVNAYCRDNHGGDFVELAPADQDTVLSGLESGSIKLDAVPAGTFFGFLLDNTREGYLSDPKYGGNFDMLAWSYVGFPGARASFREWVGQYDRPYPLGPVSISGERA